MPKINKVHTNFYAIKKIKFFKKFFFDKRSLKEQTQKQLFLLSKSMNKN